MSTQHPDNVATPFFSKGSIIEGEDEIEEAFYVYSNLKVDEQLWDTEGKEVDNHVVEKLLSRYPSYFQKNVLGKDKILTLRVPNPDVEKTEGKILLETLNSIPRNFDLAKAFYKQDVPPIFELMIPMCSSEKNITRAHHYYKEHIIKRQNLPVLKNDITLSQWLGKFGPEDIRVTPLFETKDAIIDSAKYLEKYIKSEKVKEYQRVWFARSDPALNYSSTAAVLIMKIGLMKQHELEERSSIDILPIIGCGSAPFRGNFRPDNVKHMAKAYPSIQTFTVQSAFKYDYPLKDVLQGVEDIRNIKRGKPVDVDVDRARKLIDKMEKDYVSCIKVLAPKINMMSNYIPQRRKRKLHIGLFGYSRSTKGITLPRAIKFCAAFYSFGLPPEILGLSTLTGKEIDEMREWYKTIDTDLAEAFQYINKKNLKYFPTAIQKKVLKVLDTFEYEVNDGHKQITTEILDAVKKKDKLTIQGNVIKAGQVRQFLG